MMPKSDIEAMQSLEKPAVVILNMHYSGLGIARNLSHLGVHVYGLGSSANFPGNYSKHCRFVLAPDSRDQKTELLNFLMDFGKRFNNRPVLFPTRDHDIHFINGFRQELEKVYRFAFPALNIMDYSMNKDKLYLVAKNLGMDCPKTFTLNGVNDLEAVKSELPFPCIVKPVYSSQWRKPLIWDAVGRQKVAIMHSFSELITFYRNFVDLDPLINIQEVIPGPETNLVIYASYSDAKSEVINAFTARKVLQYPQLFGTGIIVEGIAQPDIEERSRTLISALKLTGISEIEYKRDVRSGKYYLIEVNPRHWDQHSLGPACGVNLSETAYLDCIGKKPKHMQQSSSRVKWIAEADLALQILKALRAGFKPSKELFLLLGGPKIYSVWDIHDWKPGVVQAINLLREFKDLAISLLLRKTGRKVNSL
jgi:D-aspartate ligase